MRIIVLAFSNRFNNYSNRLSSCKLHTLLLYIALLLLFLFSFGDFWEIQVTVVKKFRAFFTFLRTLQKYKEFFKKPAHRGRVLTRILISRTCKNACFIIILGKVIIRRRTEGRERKFINVGFNLISGMMLREGGEERPPFNYYARTYGGKWTGSIKM